MSPDPEEPVASSSEPAASSGGSAASPGEIPPSTRGPLLGIVLTVVIFLALIALLSWLMWRSGAAGNNYYNNLMDRGKLEQDQPTESNP